MRIQSTLTVLVLAAVALAGCADDGPAKDSVVDPNDVDETQLEQGKGAIAGLVVDDRFRPIIGADVLIQEAGITVTSNENGEFAVVDLEPGTYTLRVNAEGHEATPSRINVDEGQFAEAQLLARRVSTAANVIITEEHTAFIPCAFVAPGYGLFTLNCVLDLSGDSFRSSVTVNYAESYGSDIQYLVGEVLVSQSGQWSFPLRDSGSACPCYGRDDIDADNWGKVILKNDPNEAYDGTSEPWTHENQLNVGLFYAGDIDTPLGYQGVKMGIEGRFMISLFLSEPEVDLETYTVYRA